MTRPALPLLLALTAASFDAADARRLAAYALLAAIPAAAAYALDSFGRLVDLAARAPGRVLARAEAGAAFFGLLLVVGVAASRSPAAVAPLDDSVVVAAAALFGLAAAAGVARPAATGDAHPTAGAAPEPDAKAA